MLLLLSLVFSLFAYLGTQAVDPSIVAGFNNLGLDQVIRGLPKFETQGGVKEAPGVNGMAMSLDQKGNMDADAACIAAPSVANTCPFAFDSCQNGVTITLWTFIKPFKGACSTLFSIGDGFVAFTPGDQKGKVMIKIALNDTVTFCMCDQEEWEQNFLGKWVHLAFVTDPGSQDVPVKVYKDGEVFPLDGPNTHSHHFSTPLDDQPSMFIGCRGNAFMGSDHGVCGFRGLMDEFQVYAQALSADEVRGVYQQYRPGNTASGPSNSAV